MACIGCSTTGADGKVAGCKSNGGCSTGGCNKMNTYDWISVLDIEDPDPYLFLEVSFKNGTNKEFIKRDISQEVITGDWVVVETAGGQDVGVVTLSGELVRLQMKKKGFHEDRILYKVMRLATDRDVENMHQARKLEKLAMVKGRAIARSLGLDMKISDVAYQADHKKATFYYIADRRIDFRELVRVYAKEFRIKIEMRQIGARQESARVGGIGSCGRELCCSTWLSDFKTVVTSAARYQNLAINQAKLSGQCGRLKCCLNYELDVYMESLERFPMDIETIKSGLGRANLFKTDIFKGIMFYELENNGKASRESSIFGLSPEQVKEIKIRNDRGEIPADFGKTISAATSSANPAEEDAGFADVTGEIELPEEKRKPNRNRNSKQRSSNQNQRNQGNPREGFNQSTNQNRPPRPDKSNRTNQQSGNNPKPNQQNKDLDKQNPQGNSSRSNTRTNSRNRPNDNRNYPNKKSDTNPNNRNNPGDNQDNPGNS